MSTPSGSASTKTLEDLLAAADALKRKRSELQMLRDAVAKADHPDRVEDRKLNEYFKFI